MADTSPVALLQTALDYLSPYLPYPIQMLLRLSLKSLASLPPGLATLVPILLAAFAAYTAVLSMISTARYALRTTWFLVKWGTLAAVVAWLASGAPSVNLSQQADGARGLWNRYQNGYYTGNNGAPSMESIVSQAAAGLGFGANNHNNGWMGNLLDPLNMLGNVIHFMSPDDQATANARRSASRSKQTSSTRRSRGRQQEPVNAAFQWAQNAAGKAWDMLNSDSPNDRWAESRSRREQRERRNR